MKEKMSHLEYYEDTTTKELDELRQFVRTVASAETPLTLLDLVKHVEEVKTQASKIYTKYKE